MVLAILAFRFRSLVFVQLAEHPGAQMLTTLASRIRSLVVVRVAENPGYKRCSQSWPVPFVSGMLSGLQRVRVTTVFATLASIFVSWLMSRLQRMRITYVLVILVSNVCCLVTVGLGENPRYRDARYPGP